MKRSIFFVTGTNTGVGKTIVSGLLVAHLQAMKAPAVALKPVCSGGRGDAVFLRRASGNRLALEETNPWHFRLPLAPLVAARREHRRLHLAQVLACVRRIQKRFPLLVVEGAGGLLSPLGENFDALDLIERLDAVPVVVASNELGAINQVRLVLSALPRDSAEKAQVVLSSVHQPDRSCKSNLEMLGELFGCQRVHLLPRLRSPVRIDRALADARIARTMTSVVEQSEESAD